MRDSGRPIEISEGAFAAIQARRQPTLARMEAYLKSRFGEADPAVLRGFAELPREYFHYNYEARQAWLLYKSDASDELQRVDSCGCSVSETKNKLINTVICR